MNHDRRQRSLTTQQRNLRNPDHYPRSQPSILFGSVRWQDRSPPPQPLLCTDDRHSCRRKDNTKPAPLPTPPITPSSSSYFDVPTVDILPQRSPTVIRPVSLTFSDLSIDDDPNSSSDEDDSTEPTRYLTDFPPNTWTTDSKLPRRPQYTRASTTTTGSSSSALPSLIHSPTSSVGTLASISSSRPLPSRRLNSHNNNNKLIDLVTPFPTTSTPLSITPQDGSLTSSASTLTSFRVVEADDLSYAKCPPDGDDRGRRRRSQAQGSLKQLFSHEAIRAAPVDGCVLKQ